MQEKPDFTIDRLRACLVSIPFHEKMLSLMKECQAKHANIMDVLIISDANTFYIHEILLAHGIRDFFGDRIITNPASFSSSGRLRVSRLTPATDPPHNCINRCAVNICKGKPIIFVLRLIYI
jgi:2,3-diketo-5-methylthio-1-phosphopentane phosphatase